MIAPAMNTRPQEALPYLDLARQAARITRRISLNELSRVARIVESAGGRTDRTLEVTLQFGRSDDALVRVSGEIDGDLELVCQGCAEALLHHLIIDFDCLIVESEAAARQADAQAPSGGRPETLVVAHGRHISIADLVEDEILLGLPERLCTADPCERAPGLSYPAEPAASGAAAGADGPGAARDTDNPFSVLAELTNHKRSSSE